MTLDEYIAWYQEHYGKRPSERLMESFCRANGLPWPPEKKREELHTLDEWAAMDGITILDPDGFDRTDPHLWELKFTREEYDKGIILCTIEGRSRNE